MGKENVAEVPLLGYGEKKLDLFYVNFQQWPGKESQKYIN